MATIVIERLSSGSIKMTVGGNTRYFAGGTWDIDPTADDAAFYIRHSSGFSLAVKDGDTVNGTEIDNNADEIAEVLATDIFFLASSGGGGMVLESYTNAVMSAAIQAYVFRDADNNIMRVYDPAKGNDISRRSFALADTIDKFPFDNARCFSNRLCDVKLIDFDFTDGVTEIARCEMDDMVINVNNHTQIIFNNHKQKGHYGEVGTIRNAEIYIVGDQVTFTGNIVGSGSPINQPTFFDEVGEFTVIRQCNFGQGGWVKCNNTTGLFMWDCTFFENVCIEIHSNDCLFEDCTIMNNAIIIINETVDVTTSTMLPMTVLNINAGCTSVESVYMGNSVEITTAFNITQADFEHVMTLTLTEETTDKQYKNIAGAVYVLGVSGGNITATAV